MVIILIKQVKENRACEPLIDPPFYKWICIWLPVNHAKMVVKHSGDPAQVEFHAAEDFPNSSQLFDTYEDPS